MARPEKLRILVLSKRQYMARDLLDDRYGRFWELPLELAAAGHSVEGICLSYRPRPEATRGDGPEPVSVDWTSLNLQSLLCVGQLGYLQTVDRIARRLRPDVIWACSDAAHAMIGVAVARRLRSRLVIDLYDNFESYPIARVPFVVRGLRGAVRAADAVTSVSAPLARLVRDKYRFSGPIAVIENAIPSETFKPRSDAGLRAEFGLPEHAKLIGTAGALSMARGTQFLIQAFEDLARERADVHLVLAGALDGQLEIPSSDRIHLLGLLAPHAVPRLLATLDISVVCNRDSAFGRYCFPQKLYESLATNLPVAVARVGAMAELLAEFPENLYTPDDSEDLLRVLRNLCLAPTAPSIEIPTWETQGQKLENILQLAVSRPLSMD